MTAETVLSQDPNRNPASTDRSPAPSVHGSDDDTEMMFRAAHRAFIDAFRARAQGLDERARQIRDMFPIRTFSPPMAFNAPDMPSLANSPLTAPLAKWSGRRFRH